MASKTLVATVSAVLAITSILCGAGSASAQVAPPANDLCSGAVVLSANTPHYGTSVAATSANDGPSASCSSFSGTMAVWFTFTPAASGSYQISSCGSRYDTVLQVFTQVDCTTFNNANFVRLPGGCDDSQCGPSPGPGGPGTSNTGAVIALAQLTAGQQYWIRLASTSNTNNGLYQIAVYDFTKTGACCSSTGVCTVGPATQCWSPRNTVVFLGAGTTCSPNSCVGACCNTVSNACTIATPGTAGCNFQGYGTVCSVNPCPIGACCTSTGVCTITQAAGCAPGSGWLGAGTTCTASACTSYGACCNTTTFACTLIPGNGTGCPAGTAFQGFGTTCASNPCVTGSCCNAGGGCTITDRATCGSNTWKPGGTCSPNPCSYACCNTTTFACTIAAGASCPAGTTHMGTGVTCTPNPCVTGACCSASGVCTFGLASACFAAAGGSTFMGAGTTCSPTPCVGACCSTTELGTCSIVSNPTAGCSFQGYFTTCTAEFCQLGACCTTAGACSIVQAVACPGTSQFLGAGVSCSPAPCPPSGACCDPAAGTCALTFISNCNSPRVFQGTGTTCNPTPCPPAPTPANDDCGGAIALDQGVPMSGTASGASGVGLGGTCGTLNTQNVWYAFTPAADGGYQVVCTPASATDLAAGIAVGTICPMFSNSDAIACVVGGSVGALSTVSFNGQGGTTYFISVSVIPSVSTRANFSISVSPTGLGACCNTSTGVCTTSSGGGAIGCPAGTLYQGDAVLCSASPCGQGACCNSTTGACSLSTSTGCPVGTSTFLGAGSVCASNPCNQGACCNSTNGVCVLSTLSGCSASSTFQGVGSVCNPNPCTQPGVPANDDCGGAVALTLGTAQTGTVISSTGFAITGACTNANVDVWYTFTPAATGGFRVTATPATTSDVGTSITIGTVCPMISSADSIACIAQPGTGVASTVGFVGTGGTTYFIRLGALSANPIGNFSVVVASATVGACCNNTSGACTVTITGTCSGGTTYQGANSVCAPSPCLQGACCNNTTGACSLTTSSGCASASVTFKGNGSVCSPALCAQGACCVNATGVCSLSTAAGCPATSTFQGAETVCSPSPCQGACCNNTTGGCTLTAAAGCGAGSTFQGVGSGCATNFCPQPSPPLNDDCGGSVVLSEGVAQPGTVNGASGLPISGGCTNTNADVWYVFTPAAPGSYTVTTTPSTNTDVGTSITVSAFCPISVSSEYLACVGQPSTGATNALGFQAAAGNTYFIRVGAMTFTVGSFSIVVRATSVGACCDTASGQCTLTATGAPGCAAGAVYQGVNSSCSPSPCGGACCTNLGCTVAPSAGACAGTFLGLGTVCSPDTCPTPANDTCGTTNPVVIIGSPATGTNVGAGTSSSLASNTSDPFCGQPGMNSAGKDVFWRFVPPVTTTYIVDSCGSSFDTAVSIHSDCPASDANKLSCNDDSTSGPTNAACGGNPLNSRIGQVSLAAGNTYYIRVSGFLSASGAVALNVNYVSPPLGENCCRGTTCNLVAAGTCTGQVAGSASLVVSSCGAGTALASCCYADFNHDGAQTIDDLFLYLNAYFTGSPYANMGGNGTDGPTIDDLFLYINAYFGTCS